MKRSKRWLVLCVALALLWAGCSSEPVVREPISHTLEALGVTDVVLTDQSGLDAPVEGCVLYTSEAHQKGYFFSEDTGLLEQVRSYSMMYPGYEAPAGWTDPAPVAAVGDPARYETLLSFAANCIAPNQIGELELEIPSEKALCITMWQWNMRTAYPPGPGCGSSAMRPGSSGCA